MPRFAANLTMLFNEVDFLPTDSRLPPEPDSAASSTCFSYDYSADQLAELLSTHGLTQVLHNLPAGDWDGGDRGIACDPDRVGEFQDGVGNAIEYARALSCPQVNCLAGIVPRSVSAQVAHDTFVQNLKFAAGELESAGIRLLIEPINTIDIPGFLLTRTHQARSIISEVASPNLLILHDIYHMQIMEGDLAADHRAEPRHDRPHAARRQSRTKRAGHGRDQLPVPLRPDRQVWIRRMDWMRVSSGIDNPGWSRLDSGLHLVASSGTLSRERMTATKGQ